MTDRPLTIGVIGTGASVTRALVGRIGPAPIRDPLDLAPARSGPHGRAWMCDAAALQRMVDCPPEKDATVAHLIVEAPWAHPAWHSYSVLLMHLRPIPDLAPPKIYRDGATHELLVHALNPDEPRAPVIAGAVPRFPWLEPCNFAAQLVEPSDAAALARVEDAVQAICDGRLSPDTDFSQAWAAMFGGHMLKR